MCSPQPFLLIKHVFCFLRWLPLANTGACGRGWSGVKQRSPRAAPHAKWRPLIAWEKANPLILWRDPPFFVLPFFLFCPTLALVHGWLFPAFSEKKTVSVVFLPAILGPEMAAPILWATGIFWCFLPKKPPVHVKVHVSGGVGVFWKGGWKCQFYSCGRRDFSDFCALLHSFACLRLRTFVRRPILGSSVWTSFWQLTDN